MIDSGTKIFEMDSVTRFCESTLRYFKYAPIFFWNILVGIINCFIPSCLYAKDVSGDIVLITGAGSGLGRAIALEYAKLNSCLVLWDINEDGLNETKTMIEREYEKNQSADKSFCKIYKVDVSQRSQVYSAAEKVVRDINKDRPEDEPERYISVLINNAGIYHGLMFQDLKDDQIERIFKINILAHFWTVRAFLPTMIENKKGHIVEIASMGGITGLGKQVDYCATKFATVGFEESLSSELDQMGLADQIRTTVVCPLFFNSNLFTGFDTSTSPLMRAEFVAHEAVMAMRCNQNRVLLPRLGAYILAILKPFLPRAALITLGKASGFVEGIKEIKGHAATVSAH